MSKQELAEKILKLSDKNKEKLLQMIISFEISQTVPMLP